MILKQYYLACLSHASYLIGDEETRTAIIVDPQRDIDQYVDDAKALGLVIRHVFLTHFHADFVAGHLELRDRCGAIVHLGARAEAEYAFEPACESSPLQIGNVCLVFLETPGHTPEGISIVVYDLAKDREKPHAVLTGDTLFIGDVGRPDLFASVGLTAVELAGMLYDSLREKLMKLPDETLVYPAHGAGSACGKNLSTDTVSTIGKQRALNHALQPMGREQFIALVTTDQPEAPKYFGFDADLNKRERATLDEALAGSLRPIGIDEALKLSASGCQVVDTREPAEFANGHLARSVNIALSGKYATWSGTLLAGTHPIVLLAAPGRERESAMRLGRIGFDQVAGYVEGGFAALATRADLVRSWKRVTPSELTARLRAADAPIVIDVRAASERAKAHIEGSLSVPLTHLEEHLGDVPRDRDLVVHCAGGYRSSIGASLLEKHGFTRVTDLEGGLAAWQAAGLPTIGDAAVSGQACRIS